MSTVSSLLELGTFDVLYADPPWAYRKTALHNRGRARAVEKEYPTMQPEELMRLPVVEVAAANSVLFLWATSPKLPLAIDVMRAWGFDFKTVAFVWCKLTRDASKPAFGMGFYTRSGAEMCLVGTRGNGLPRRDASVRQVVVDPYDGPSDEMVGWPLARHSEKPDEVRHRIERLYEGRRLELFARERVREWSVWGNDPSLLTP